MECPSVVQQWVDQFRREEPEELDPRLIAYGAYLLALRTVYGIRRQPRTPWRSVSCARTLHMWIHMWRVVTMASRDRRINRLVIRDLHRNRRIDLARARALGPRQWATTALPFYCGPVWGTVELRYVYVREEYGRGTVRGVGAYRSTRHLGYEVADPSGRHGWPAIVAEPGRGLAYHWSQMEFAVGRTPKWTFTFEVGQNTEHEHQLVGDINVLTMPQPPQEPDVEELDAWGRGPDSESDNGCDTETESDTEDDEVLSRRGRYPAGYPFLQNTLKRHRQ